LALLARKQCAYVWLGPFGVKNHETASRPITTAKRKTAGNTDDMVDEERRLGTGVGAKLKLPNQKLYSWER
jgi:hypothetical protein